MSFLTLLFIGVVSWFIIVIVVLKLRDAFRKPTANAPKQGSSTLKPRHLKQKSDLSKQMHFFATKQDSVTILKNIESQIKLKYVYTHKYAPIYKTSKALIRDSLLDFKRLGFNKGRAKHSSDCFLVMDKNASAHFTKTINYFFIALYSAYQISNMDSIEFRPGGMYGSKYLISGSIGTISDSKQSLHMYKLFSKSIKKDFKKIGNYYVGKNAFQLLQNGSRLITMGIDEPKEYDLSIIGI